jgi:lysozyme
MIPGIDVSHYQGSIDWSQVKAAGIRFAYIKATQGASFVDPDLQTNIQGAANVGIPFGLYQVFMPNCGEAQLDIWENAFRYSAYSLPPWIDVEPGAVTEDTAPQLLLFLAETAKISSMTPCLYASPSTIQGLMPDPTLLTYGLAIAQYTDAPQPNFAPWPSFLFWQYSQSGTVPGIDGPVDLDWFNGSDEQFQALVVGASQGGGGV